MDFGKRTLLIVAVFSWPFGLMCQTQTTAPYRLYGGFTYFSNSFNAAPAQRSSLLGWDSAAEFPAWRNLRFKMDFSGTTGTNGGASQKAMFFLGGGQYERSLSRERIFAHALVGDIGITRNWGPNSVPGMTASFAVLLGGGIDTPVSPHFAWRVEGDMQHTNLDLVDPNLRALPFNSPGLLPRFMGRISTGLVWTPKLNTAVVENRSHSEPPQSDVIVEDENSFGHWHIFAYTWWSYLHLAGVEYDRNSWGTFLRARMDYVGEILPVVVLEQPAKSDPWGDQEGGTTHTTNPGLAIAPIGVRFLWRPGTRVQPYFIMKGGMVGFTNKALSPYASYENFTLQQMTGVQIRLTGTWEMRAGVSDFHFSNGFIVPNDPGIDEMMWGGALVYRLHRRQSGN